MPVLVSEEVIVEPKKEKDLPKERKEPVICVFDPVGLHAIILGFALGEILDQAEVFWQSQFSRTHIDMGDISKGMYPSSIAAKKPVLLISELEVIPGEHLSGECLYGIEMLQNLRNEAGLKNTPLMVISSDTCLTKAQEEFRKELKELDIGWFFTWGCLESKPGEQKRLFSIVAEILGLGPKS